jgi:histidyl-tRNA synthetase
MKSETVKGFNDYTGEEAEKRAVITEVIRQNFERYGFSPAETPIIEYEEFVNGENKNDEAVRDIFKLKDRGKRNLALRYEFTFQLKRLAQGKKLPYKRYQIGYNFRDEPVRKGRCRQFIQCDGDVIGSTIKDEAECLAIFQEVLKKLGIKFTIYINNRKLLNEILEKEEIKEKEAVIREIDKMDKLTKLEVQNNLKKYNAEKIFNIFNKQEEYFEKYENYSEIKKLKEYCNLFEVDVKFRPFLARGFSYYNGSVFEVWADKLNVSICAGGSYLINNQQSTGISFGLEPIMLLSNLKIKLDKYLLVSLNEDKKTISLAKKLRSLGKVTSIFYGKPSKALEYANSYKINKVIFIGKQEIKKKIFKIKNMKTGKEEILRI